MATDRAPESGATLDDETVTALHEVELGYEWLQRANGHLLQFHHATGHGMDHLAAAEEHLRAAGHADLANAIRDDLLPRGVVDDDRWSYDLVEEFQHGILTDVDAFEREARDELAAGDRHVAERLQERRWKERRQGE
ncbi:hypothetical protein L593_09675 [Salinarchaeum sp. Harcht-Bsk1]|uniref:hypothetical protein n=1 Tax=Salinarchaeum sp. Harcht-Bsk1 TaxID=1333523 RepID=UPI0003423C17|nr:hypothetical protein [Salinarchaeum sp. Harcht-Bsk1]AGN01880.1 hypothetical protein L593_09675 [Salinarchaeum sp. Harcht-Bsk1]